MNRTHETKATENAVSTNSEPVEVTSSIPASKPKTENASNNKRIKAANSAASKDPGLAGSYRVTTNMNMRHGAGMSEQVMIVIPKNTKVRNYGFYTEADDTKWLYVQAVLNNIVYSGFCSSAYLDKI